jgi:hypothetical protein
VENPEPDDPEQFVADMNLHEKLHAWKEAFFWILTQYYKVFKLGDPEKGIAPGIHEPKEVLEVTNQYRNRNDVMSEFMQEHTAEEIGQVTMLIDLYTRYLTWCKLNGLSNVSFGHEAVKQPQRQLQS